MARPIRAYLSGAGAAITLRLEPLELVFVVAIPPGSTPRADYPTPDTSAGPGVGVPLAVYTPLPVAAPLWRVTDPAGVAGWYDFLAVRREELP